MTTTLPRKRTRDDDDDDEGPSKKPFASGSRVEDSPEPRETDSLEAFRKEAIYRRMKFYSREHDKANERLARAKLDGEKQAAALAAMESCWNTLIERLRLLLKPEGSIATYPTFLCVSSTSVDNAIDEELASALEERNSITKQLFEINAGVNGSSGRTQSQSPMEPNIKDEFERLSSENTAFRAQVDVLRKRIADIDSALERTRDELELAEGRLDRLHRSSQPPKLPTIDTKQGTPSESEAVSRSSRPPESEPMRPAEVMINGNHSVTRVEESVSESDRDAELRSLAEQIKRQADELVLLKQEHADPDDQTIAKYAKFRALQADNAALARAYSETLERWQQLQKEHEEHDRIFSERITNLQDDCRFKLDELKAQVAKRDSDINRLRESRDSMTLEMQELQRAKEANPNLLAQEASALLSARQERIVALQNEVKRLRASTAAASGDEELFRFIMDLGDDEAPTVDSLRQTIISLRGQLAIASRGFNGESELRTALSQAEEKIRKLESAFRGFSSEDLRLKDLIMEKQNTIGSLRLELEAKQAEISSQQAALDQLAVSWDELNQKMGTRLFDAQEMEQKLNKLWTEKAKADNKYFSLMRLREAEEAEKKHTARNLEKQTKHIAKLEDQSSGLEQQSSARAQETKQLQLAHATLTVAHASCEREVLRLQAENDHLHIRLMEIKGIYSNLVQATTEKEVALAKLEDINSRLRKDLDKANLKAKTPVQAPVGETEKDLQQELDKCMSLLKCSTCKLRFRSQLLSKCLHTFCKDCIDARLSTRQRKCPYCGLAFAQSDVQQLWLQ